MGWLREKKWRRLRVREGEGHSIGGAVVVAAGRAVILYIIIQMITTIHIDVVYM